jgi:hypothetical protein
VTVRLVQKLLEILLSMRGLLIHLFMLSNVLASFSFSSFSSFSRYDFRCLIGLLYGWLFSLHYQYGVEWALSWGWKGISLISTILLPSFASLFTSSLPIILVWALTLCRWMVAVWFLSILTIDANIFLSGWLFCCVGCFIWVLMRYREFKLSVKMCAGSLGNSCVRICKVW